MLRRTPLLLPLLLLASLAGTAAAQHAAEQAAVAPSPRLPTGVRPTHYDVSLEPDAAKLTFRGRTVVAIEVERPSATITLNALEVHFTRVELTPDGGRPLARPRVALDAAQQRATFTFGEPLRAGSYHLAMDYTGTIQTEPVGIFALDYPVKDGDRRALFTEFEVGDARRMVPSWDEPAYKATFTLDTMVPAGEMAVSNMPVESTTAQADGSSRVRFATTPRMSTYLLVLGIGDFERITTKVDGVVLGVVAQRGRAEQGRYALDESARVLAEYHRYFGIPYPLPKLDNIAAPGQSTSFSAMENWGGILTYEYALLLEPTMASERDREGIFTDLAHEMAHMWFGDLVTMGWWDDLWLNEGFASWMGGRTTERLHPEWKLELEAVRSRHHTLNADALSTTHAIVQRVDTIEQANQAFDYISYGKGRAVLSMLEAYVGEEPWRAGIHRYLVDHAYGNTKSDDLWRAVQASAKSPILDIAHDFTLQPGVPLVRVDGGCRDGRMALDLRQDELRRDEPPAHPLSWRVPVVARSLAGASATALVSGGHATLDVASCEPVVVNAGQKGYFRTLYAPPLMAALLADSPRLAPADRLGVLTDAWELGLDGLEPPGDALDWIARLAPDDAPPIWSEVSAMLDGLDRDAERLPLRPRVRSFAVARLTPVLARLGWEPRKGEPATDALLRPQLIEVLGDLGDGATIAEARRRNDRSSTDPAAVPPALKRTILAVVSHHADAATWEATLAKARAERTPVVRDRLYRALASVEDEALARRALDLAITEEPGATNSPGMIGAVAQLHPDLAFDFVVAHFTRVDQLVESSTRDDYYASLARSSRDPATIAKLEAFAAAHAAPSARRPYATVSADIRYRDRVRRERLPLVDAWLTAHGAG